MALRGTGAIYKKCRIVMKSLALIPWLPRARPSTAMIDLWTVNPSELGQAVTVPRRPSPWRTARGLHYLSLRGSRRLIGKVRGNDRDEQD